MPDIHAIYRYPIKGLSPELLLRAELLPHETIPGDRLYAIENTDHPALIPPRPVICRRRIF